MSPEAMMRLGYHGDFVAMCEKIINCDRTRKVFWEYYEKDGVDEALEFLKRAHRSVIQSKIPLIEEWYASIKTKI